MTNKGYDRWLQSRGGRSRREVGRVVWPVVFVGGTPINSRQELVELFQTERWNIQLAFEYVNRASNYQLHGDQFSYFEIKEWLLGRLETLTGLEDSVGLTHDGGASLEEGSPSGSPTNEDQMELW